MLYFEDLLNPTSMSSSGEGGPGDPVAGSPISGAVVADLVIKLLGGRAPGLDVICPEFLTIPPTPLINIAWTSGTVSMD